MPAKKKKAPVKIGGYSYDKVVKNKDKNGRPIFFKKENGKKIRTSAAAYQKVQDTKQYFKTKYNKDWQAKYKSAQSTLKSTLKDEKKKDDARQRKEKEIELSKDISVTENITTFANSMPSDVESQVLRYGSALITLKGKSANINKNNLIDARLYFSVIADKFYEKWHERQTLGYKDNTPQITYNWHITSTKKFKTNELITKIFITLDETVFTFEAKYFFNYMLKEFINYFGN